MSSKPLINQVNKEVGNIIGGYVDEEDYKNLNELDPVTFTNDGLFLKLLQEVDRADVVTFAKVFEHAQSFVDTHFPYDSVDPLFVTSVIFDLITNNEDLDSIDDTDPREFIYSKIEERLNQIKEDFKDNFNEYLKDINSNNEGKFDQLLALELDNQFFVLDRAYKKMIKQEKKVYETANFAKYSEKIIPYLTEEFKNFQEKFEEKKSKAKYNEYFTDYQKEVIKEFAEMNNVDYTKVLNYLIDNKEINLPDPAFEFFAIYKLGHAPRKTPKYNNIQLMEMWENLKNKKVYLESEKFDKEKFFEQLKEKFLEK